MYDLDKIKEDLVLASKRAYRRGIQTGDGGNVSARISDTTMLVKASGKSFEDGGLDDFVITDFEGNKIEGDGEPTREALLHGYLYKICPNVKAVVHVHSPYCVAISETEKILPRVTWHCKLKVCADIPILDVDSAMVRQQDLPLIKDIFDNEPKLPAFILKNHGLVAVGKDAINAEHMAELMEETSQIFYLQSIMKKMK